MLIRLSTTNFLSFDSAVEFSMLVSKESRFGERVAAGELLPGRLLQTAAIWGGNASGKSNFCKVLMFARWLVVHGTRPDAPTTRRPFRLRKGAAEEPSRFEFEILVEDRGEERVLRYAFAVTGKEVVEESLAEVRSVSERVYFTRKAGKEGPEFTLDWWERKVVPEEDRQFARFVAMGTKANQLFLHEAMDRNLKLLAPVYRWFRDQLEVIQPDDLVLPLETQESGRPELRDYAAKLLEAAGTGITSIVAVEVPAAAMGILTEDRERILDSIKDEDGGVIFRSSDGGRFSVFRKEGDLLTSRLVTFRKTADGRSVQFELSEESDGTRRVFDLSPLFHDLENPDCRKVYVIDEFDRSMHHLLSRALIEHYLSSRSPGTRTQLILTLQDPMLIDQSLFRRDEMWFMERGPNGESSMECLSDYKDVRYDKDVRKAYLEGRFSGVPQLKPFRRRIRKPGRTEQPELPLNEDAVEYKVTPEHSE